MRTQSVTFKVLPSGMMKVERTQNTLRYIPGSTYSKTEIELAMQRSPFLDFKFVK